MEYPGGLDSTATDPAAFCYEPLSSADGQIRLLEIALDVEDAPIHCSLQVHDFFLDPDGGELLGLPEFHAISYTWGSPHLVKTILINGQLVGVRQNCWFALWQARLVRPGCLIWVDAICIDQQDTTEKSQQVALMGKIFFTATAALASLGPHSDDSEFLWEQLNTGHGRVSDKRLSHSMEFSRLTRAMVALTQRSYWSRMWIVQEVAFSREVHFVSGRDTLHMSFELRRVFDDILFRNDLFQDIDLGDTERKHNRTANFTEVLNTATYHKELKRPIGLLLKLFRRFECSDPRDKIYSLLEMADLPPEALVQPNYNISAYKLAVQLLKRGTLCDHHRPATLSNLTLLVDALELDPECLDIVEAISRKKAAASQKDVEIDRDPELPPFFRRHTTQASLQSIHNLVDLDFRAVERKLGSNEAQHNREDGEHGEIDQLLIKGQFAGVTSSNARKGDILYGVLGSADASSPVLVLRPTGLDIPNTSYRIVGRGRRLNHGCDEVFFDEDLGMASPLEFSLDDPRDVIILTSILNCKSTAVIRELLEN